MQRKTIVLIVLQYNTIIRYNINVWTGPAKKHVQRTGIAIDIKTPYGRGLMFIFKQASAEYFFGNFFTHLC